jgi:DNA-binding CsgD family transcriptional regulator/PAS domain-containing protein
MTPMLGTIRHDDSDALSRRAAMPVAIVNSWSGKLDTVNTAFETLFRLDTSWVGELDVFSFVSTDHRQVVEGVLAGVGLGLIESCHLRSSARLPTGDDLEVLWWIRALEPGRASPRALLAVAPAEAIRLADEGVMATGAQPAVVVVVDGEGTVQELTAEGVASLDWGHADAIGSRLHAVVHTDDVAGLEFALARSDAEGQSIATALRLRGSDGSWSTVRAQLSRLSGPPSPRFAVTLFPLMPREAAEPPAALASRLQEHLRRIALEVQAAGIGGVATTEETWWTDPALAKLSARQLEITQLLVRGDRVPAIARKLFLSQSTVRNHLASVYWALGVHSQAELLSRLKDG